MTCPALTLASSSTQQRNSSTRPWATPTVSMKTSHLVVLQHLLFTIVKKIYIYLPPMESIAMLLHINFTVNHKAVLKIQGHFWVSNFKEVISSLLVMYWGCDLPSRWAECKWGYLMQICCDFKWYLNEVYNKIMFLIFNGLRTLKSARCLLLKLLSFLEALKWQDSANIPKMTPFWKVNSARYLARGMVRLTWNLSQIFLEKWKEIAQSCHLAISHTQQRHT